MTVNKHFKAKPHWWTEGIRFECQGSGKCCTSHGSYGFVYVTLEERELLAKKLNITVEEFSQLYCEVTDGFYHLKDRPNSPDCIFLDGKRCGVYEARPTQCRTWPFWPEVMNPKSWKKDVVSFCPGIGKGKLYSEDEIEKILTDHTAANHQLHLEQK